MEQLEPRVVFAGDCPDFPNPIPMPCDDECACGASEESVSAQGDGGSGVNAPGSPSPFSLNPVNYFSGLPAIKSVDLASYGFGNTLSVTRSWSGNENAGMTGHGWNSVQDPYLVVYSTFDQATGLYNNPIVGFVQSGQKIDLFDIDQGNVSGSWPSRFYGRQNLAFNTTTSEWTLTDASGQRFVFYDLPRDESLNLDAFVISGGSDTGLYGKLRKKIDASGFITDYTYDSNDRLQHVTESDPATGQAHRLERSYTTLSLSGVSLVVASSITLSRRDSSSLPFVPIRTATYEYYTGAGAESANGRLGDLKLALIREGASTGAVIEAKYYRYNKFHGLSISPSIYGDDLGGTFLRRGQTRDSGFNASKLIASKEILSVGSSNAGSWMSICELGYRSIEAQVH